MTTSLNHKFHQILEQHKGILLKVARAYCQNEEDRQDLLQEMMIHIWKSLPRYDNTFAMTTWLYRISLNVAISFYRKNTQKQHLGKQPFNEQLSIYEDTNSEKQEQLNLLEQFIAELNDLDKALILLYLEDKSHAEIAEIMDLSVSNVGTKVGRIKEKLKNKFLQLKS